MTPKHADLPWRVAVRCRAPCRGRTGPSWWPTPDQSPRLKHNKLIGQRTHQLIDPRQSENGGYNKDSPFPLRISLADIRSALRGDRKTRKSRPEEEDRKQETERKWRHEGRNREEEEETGNRRQNRREGRLDEETKKGQRDTQGRTRQEGGGVNSQLWLYLVTTGDMNERRCCTRGRRAA